MANIIMDSEGGDGKRGKHHEAHMIPGVDGSRIFGFPNTILTKLRYCTFVTLTAGTGSVASNLYAANGIFDPDITNVGHQPLYRDNYASIYDQYVVVGSKIKVTFISGTENLGNFIGITGDDDSTVTNNLETLMEQNNSVSAMVGAPGAQPYVLEAYFEPNMCFGVDAVNDGSSATTVGANPTELWVYKVWAISQDATTSTSCVVKVEIDYTVKFAELQSPVQN